MTGTCRATHCSEPLDEAWKIMCGRHWHLVPPYLQRQISRPACPADTREALIKTAVAAVELAEFGARLL